MKENKLVLNAIPNKEVFEEVAQSLGVIESFVEKDWYAVQVIEAISKLNYPNFEAVFSGGTSLSKAHHLIERFSEDVDFRIKTKNVTLTKGSCSKFKKAVVQSLTEAGFSINKEDIRAQNQNRFFQIHIKYQTFFSGIEALRPHILLEVTLDNPILSPLELPIQSFVSEYMQEPAEVPKIQCMSPIEIAADKLSAITWRIPDRIRGGEDDDPTLIRHIHDLAILERYLQKEANFRKLVLASLEKDDERPKYNENFSGLAAHKKFAQMLEILKSDQEYQKEYEIFVKGSSYAAQETLINFSEAKKIIEKLAEYVVCSGEY